MTGTVILYDDNQEFIGLFPWKNHFLLSLQGYPWALKLVLNLYSLGFNRIILKFQKHGEEIYSMLRYSFPNIDANIILHDSSVEDLIQYEAQNSESLLFVSHYVTGLDKQMQFNDSWYGCVKLPNGNSKIVAAYFKGTKQLSSFIVKNQISCIKTIDELLDYGLKSFSTYRTTIWSFPEIIMTMEQYFNFNKSQISSRSFNKITFTPYETIIKKSLKDLSDEYKFYDEMKQRNLEYIGPYVYEYNENDNSYEMEFIDSPTLSSIFVFGGWQDDTFKRVVDKLYHSLWVNRNNLCQQSIKAIYFEKTISRLEQWEDKQIMNYDYIYINNKSYLNLNQLWEWLCERIEHLIVTAQSYVSIIHGDPVFSNILISEKMGLIKFIDPRGNFGKKSVYGDSRYDAAKLRQCYHGKYDFIIHELYSISQSENCFFYKFYSDIDIKIDILDTMLTKYGFKIEDIILIETLLFLSMISLHDNKCNKTMFYLKAIETLNEYKSIVEGKKI